MIMDIGKEIREVEFEDPAAPASVPVVPAAPAVEPVQVPQEEPVGV
jgi:hypothetical protein